MKHLDFNSIDGIGEFDAKRVRVLIADESGEQQWRWFSRDRLRREGRGDIAAIGLDIEEDEAWLDA